MPFFIFNPEGVLAAAPGNDCMASTPFRAFTHCNSIDQDSSMACTDRLAFAHASTYN